MSEENVEFPSDAFPGLQIGTFIKGDQWVLRAGSGDEFARLVKSIAEHGDTIVTGLSSIKQVAVAKGVFTGESNAKSPAAAGGAGRTGSRAKDSPPPSNEVEFYTDDDGVKVASIECKHGPMLDLRDKDYKADLYCSWDTKDWKKKCKPVEL